MRTGATAPAAHVLAGNPGRGGSPTTVAQRPRAPAEAPPAGLPDSAAPKPPTAQ